MYGKTLRQIIEDGAKDGTVKNIMDAVGYVAGYLESEQKLSGRTFDAVIVLNAIRDAARDGIIDWR